MEQRVRENWRRVREHWDRGRELWNTMRNARGNIVIWTEGTLGYYGRIRETTLGMSLRLHRGRMRKN
jgi:hypothetical protein